MQWLRYVALATTALVVVALVALVLVKLAPEWLTNTDGLNRGKR